MEEHIDILHNQFKAIISLLSLNTSETGENLGNSFVSLSTAGIMCGAASRHSPWAFQVWRCWSCWARKELLCLPHTAAQPPLPAAGCCSSGMSQQNGRCPADLWVQNTVTMSAGYLATGKKWWISRHRFLVQWLTMNLSYFICKLHGHKYGDKIGNGMLCVLLLLFTYTPLHLINHFSYKRHKAQSMANGIFKYMYFIPLE